MECLDITNSSVQEWLDNTSAYVMYNEYIKNNNILPDYSTWKNINTPLQQDEKKELLFSIIPFDSFELERLSDFMYSLPTNVVGAYLNQVVYLNDNATKAEVYEEAFHAIFDKLVTKEEKDTLLKAGQSLLNTRLKKESKSITKYIEELVNKYPTIYGVLSKQDRLNRAFEEEIASEFIDSLQYANPFKAEQELTNKLKPLFGESSSYIAKLLTKIFSFFKSLSKLIKNNQDTLSVFFNKITQGEFKNSKVLNDKVLSSPTTRLLELYGESEYDEDDEVSYASLTSYSAERTQIAIKGVSAIYFQLKSSNVEVDDLLQESIKQYFTLSPDFKNDVDVTNEQNLDSLNYLKDDVKKYLDEFDALIDFAENVDEEMSNDFAKYDMSANEKDSLNTSYSQQLKLRIGKTGRIKYTETVNINGKSVYLKVIEAINVVDTYYAFARALGNTANDEVRWNKLIAFSKLTSNPDAKLFVDQLMYDLFSTHNKIAGLGINSEDEFNIKVKAIFELYNTKEEKGFIIFPKSEEDKFKVIPSDNAMIVNSIVKGFDLWSKPTIQTIFDAKTRKTKAFDANNDNSINMQVNTWQNNLQELYMLDDIAKKDIVAKLKKITFSNFKSVGLNNFDSALSKVTEFFDIINFSISKDLIVYSIINQSDFADELIPDYKDVVNNFKVFKSNQINTESLLQIKSKIELYLSDKEENIKTVFGTTGVGQRLKKFAEGNNTFDEKIKDSTYKNADGKTVFNYQYKTYHLQQLQRMLENPTDVNSYVVNEKLVDDLPFIENNYLFKKFNEQNSNYLRLVKDGRISTWSANGLRQQDSFTNSKGKTEYNEKEGVSIGNMSNRDFIIYLLNTTAGQIEGIASEENLVSPIYFGNYEASKTFEFIKLPIIKDLVDVDGNITKVLLDLINKEIEKEYNRIKKLAYESKFETTYTKYNTGQRISVTYEVNNETKTFYLPVNKGQINFGNFRGGSFSDYINGLAEEDQLEFSKEFSDFIKSKLTNGSKEIALTKEEVDTYFTNPNTLLSAYLGLPYDSNKTESSITSAMSGMFNEFINICNKEGIISNGETVLIDKLYEGKPNEQNVDKTKIYGFVKNGLETNLKRKFASDLLNTMYMNQLMQGDQGFLYKSDKADIFKRFKGRNASIVSFNTDIIAPFLGITETWNKIKYLVHGEIVAKSGVDLTDVDQADAQNYTSSKYMRYALFAMEKLTKDHAKLLDMIDSGESTIALDETIIDKSVFAPILKTVAFDGRNFLKKSDFMLTKRLTSLFYLVDDVVGEQYMTQDQFGRWIPKIGATREIVRWSDGKFREVRPRPEKNTETASLYDRRKVMEGWRFDSETKQWVYTGEEFMLSMPISASKMLNRNTMEGHDLKNITKDNINEIDLKYYGLQVETPHPHSEIPDPTQYLEITLNELKRNSVTKFTINNISYSVDELEDLYQDLLTSRRKISMDSKFKELINEKGEFKSEEFRIGFLKSLESSGSEKQTLDIVTKGLNLNHPLIKEKFVSQLFSFFSKDGLSQKRKGDAVPHVSSHGFKLIKKVVLENVNGKPLVTWKALQTDSKEYFDAIDSKTNEEWSKLDLSSYDFYPDVDNIQHTKYTANRLQDKLLELIQGNNDLEKTPVYFIDDLRHLKPRIENVGESLYKTERELDTSYLYKIKSELKLNSNISSFKDSKIENTVFHISNNKIDKFNSDRLNSNTNAPDTVLGHFFSEDYQTIADMRESKDDLLLTQKGKSSLGHEIHEVSINLKNPYFLNTFIDDLPDALNIDKNLSATERFKLSKEKLKEEGYDGIIYVLGYDVNEDGYPEISNGFVVFDDKNIKVENSKNDKFLADKYRPSDFNKKTIETKQSKITGYFDEAVLSKSNANQLEIYDGEVYMFGVRIPSQDKHSGVNIEWVDMLPAYYGSAIVVPKEIVNLSGHDFDVDKLYLYKQDGYYKNGNFYQYQNTLEDLKRYNLENNKEVRALVREFKDNEESYYTLKDEIKVIRKKKKEQYTKVKKIEESFSSLSESDKKALANLYKTKLELSNIENKIDSDSATEEDLNQRKVLLKKIRGIYKFNNVKESDILNPKVAEYSKALEDLYDLSSDENKQILDEKLEVFTELTNKIETKAFTQLGLPINQSEFEEYIKKFGFGNKGFINNTLLQANQQAWANPQTLNGGSTDTPASMGYMGNGVLTEFPLKQNIENVSKNPLGFKIKEGVYVNQEGLTKEEQLELFNYLKPYIEEQASKTNKGIKANKMLGLGLRWDYKSNNKGIKKMFPEFGDRESIEIGDNLAGSNTSYGYYNKSINGLSLGEITPRFRELISKATGINIKDYDGAIINLYDEDTFIGNHSDLEESKSAEKYPVVAVNIGGSGNFTAGTGLNDNIQLKPGAGYVFGFEGKNRKIPHSTKASKQDGFLPEITTKLDGRVYEKGSYRITITMRRIMPLSSNIKDEPEVLNNTNKQKQQYLLSDDGKTYIKTSKTKYNVHSLLGHILTDRNNRVGKANIGINVNSTLLTIVLNRIGAEINPDNSISIKSGDNIITYDKLELFLKDEDVSEKDYYNSLIGKTFNTEEWGEIKIDEINLDKDEFGFEYIKNGEKVRSKQNIFLMQSMGVGVLPMSKVEKRRVFDVLSTLTSSATDEAKEQLNARYGLSIDSLSAVIPLIAMGGNLSVGIALVNQPIVKLFLEYKAKKNYGITTEEEEKIKFMSDNQILEEVFKSIGYQGGLDDFLKVKDRYSINDLAMGLRNLNTDLTSNTSLAMLRDFLRLTAITTYGNNLIQAIKYKKGLSSDLYAYQSSIEKINKLGLFDDEFVESEVPIFIKTALLNNADTKAKDILETIKVTNEINEIVPKIVLSESELFNKFKNALKKHTKYLSSDNKKEVDSELESFIYSQLLHKELENVGEYDGLIKKYLTEFLTNLTFEDNVTKIFIKFKEEAKKVSKLRNNSLLSKLQVVNDKISFLKLNQLVKLSPTQMTELSDSFSELALDNIPLSGSISPMEFTKMLQALYIIKDGMQFKFDGISKIFPVEIFTRLSSIMDNLKNGNSEIENNFEMYSDTFIARFFESVKHKNFTNTLTLNNKNVFEIINNVNTEVFSLSPNKDSFSTLSINTHKDVKSNLHKNGLNGIVKDNIPLRYVTIKFGKSTYLMKLMLIKDGFLYYSEFESIGTTNSTVMGIPMSSTIVNVPELPKTVEEKNVFDKEVIVSNPIPSSIIEQKNVIENIYNKLGNKTVSENVVIKSVYQKAGVEYAKSIGGIFSLRIDNNNTNFGNPFLSVSSDIITNAIKDKNNTWWKDKEDTKENRFEYIESIGLIPTNSTKESVEKYIDWIVNPQFDDKDLALNIKNSIIGNALNTKYFAYHRNLDYEVDSDKAFFAKFEANTIEEIEKLTSDYVKALSLERRQWIREQLKSGKLKGKPIVYYKELGEPSHATALDYLINKYNWDENVPQQNNEVDYKYFGSWYKIILNENNQGIDVVDYKGKNIDKQKLLTKFNENPNVDPQNGKPFRSELVEDSKFKLNSAQELSDFTVEDLNKYIKELPVKHFVSTHGNYSIEKIKNEAERKVHENMINTSLTYNNVFSQPERFYVLKKYTWTLENTYGSKDTNARMYLVDTLNKKIYILNTKESDPGRTYSKIENYFLGSTYDIEMKDTADEIGLKGAVSYSGDGVIKESIKLKELANIVLNNKNVFKGQTIIKNKQSTFDYKNKSINTDFELGQQQEEILKELVDFVKNPEENIITIQGKAGTGKTSLIGYLQKYYGNSASFAYLAPTHVAVANLAFNTVKTGNTTFPSTVMSAVIPDKETGRYKFSGKITNQLNHNPIIVLDEASMLDDNDIKNLQEAVDDAGYKLIYLGDFKQISKVNTNNNKVKKISPAFDKYRTLVLDTVYRTGDNTLLNVLSNIWNQTSFKLFKSDKNKEDLMFTKNKSEFERNLEKDVIKDAVNTIVIGYTKSSVSLYNKKIRQMLDRPKETIVGDIIMGYIGYGNKQIEKQDVANSVSYVLKRIQKAGSSYLLQMESPKLKELISKGINNIKATAETFYYPLSNDDSLYFNDSTIEEQEANNEHLSRIFREMYEVQLKFDSKKIQYPQYLSKIQDISDDLRNVSVGNDYIYNPISDKMEKYDKAKHSRIKTTGQGSLLIEKDIDYGHAITAHKSQSLTIDNVYFDASTLIPDFDTPIFNAKGEQVTTEMQTIAYVAMSRNSKKLAVYEGNINFTEVKENESGLQNKSNEGEEISSYSDNLAFALTNPTHTSPQGFKWKRKWTEGQEQWRNYLSKGIEFEGKPYDDVEEAYQKNKSKYSKEKNLFNNETTDDLMVKLLMIKLNTYPKLIEGINIKGGIEYLQKSTHQPTKKNTYWETGGENGFIKSLIQAYKNVTGKDNQGDTNLVNQIEC